MRLRPADSAAGGGQTLALTISQHWNQLAGWGACFFVLLLPERRAETRFQEQSNKSIHVQIKMLI